MVLLIQILNISSTLLKAVRFCKETVSLQSEQTCWSICYTSASTKYRPISEQDSALKQLQTCSSFTSVCFKRLDFVNFVNFVDFINFVNFVDFVNFVNLVNFVKFLILQTLLSKNLSKSTKSSGRNQIF